MNGKISQTSPSQTAPSQTAKIRAAIPTEIAAHARAKKLASPVVMAAPVLKIATFHSSSLGALVASLPALAALRDSFPGARICAFARAPILPLLHCFSGVDEARARPGGGLSSQAALMARLHGGGYDLAVSFSQGSNALLLMWATGAPTRAGFATSRMDALLTCKIAKNGPLRAGDALELVRAVGAAPRGEKARDFLRIAPEISARAGQMREEAGIARDFLLVSPQTRKLEAELSPSQKIIEPAFLGELATRFDLILVGLKPNSALLRAANLSRPNAHRIVDWGGKTDVLTLAALCEMSRGVFGVGGGVLQLGRFYDKPTVSTLESDRPAERALQLFGF